MSYNSSTTPPFVVFQKPLFRFRPTGGNVEIHGGGDDSNSGAAATTNDQREDKSSERSPNIAVSRVYIDEVANDVVIFSDQSREVCFYQLLLHEEVEGGESIGRSLSSSDLCGVQQQQRSAEEEWLRHHPALCGDAISLKMVPRSGDGESVIHHAKRCPVAVYSSATGPAHLIALSVDTDAVFFFLCHSQAQGEGNGTHNLIATYQCRPRNLRFRKGVYPVCAFYWADNPWGGKGDGASQAPYRGLLLAPLTVSGRQSQQCSPSRGGDSPITSVRRIVCITSISIDLLAVPVGTKSSDNKDGWVLLCRYTTHTDYWHYCPTALAILSINRLKPWHVKVFELQDEQGLHRLPALRLEENFLAAEGERETTASSLLPAAACMDTCPIRYPVVLLALYQQLFVCSLSRRSGGVTLFRYVPPSDGGKAGGTGSFMMHAVLRTDFQLHMRREPIALQVIDNLVVLHAPRQGVSTAFDILHCEGDAEEDYRQDSGWHANTMGARASATEYETHRPSGAGLLDASDLLEGGDRVGRKAFTVSTWFEWLANKVHNSCVRRGRTCMCDGASGTEVTVPVLQPLLSAALSLHPWERVDKYDPVSCECDEIYALDFVSGAMPLLLNRRSGAVCVVGVNPFALAAVMSQPSQRVQFYLNRMYCAGRAVHALVYDMLSRQEHLAVVAHTFELIAAHHAAHRHLQAPSTTWIRQASITSLYEVSLRGSQGTDTYFFSPQREHGRTALLLGSLASLRRWLPAEDVDGPFPCSPPWRCRSYLTLQDILAACTSSHAPIHRCDISQLEEGVGQVGLECEVFNPLVDAVLSREETGAETISEGSAVDAASDVACRTSNSAHLCFGRYLFYALLEYGRCVVGTGCTLTDNLQKSIIRLVSRVFRDCGPLRHFLRSSIITNRLSTALLFLDMGEDWKQAGMEMLVKLRADAHIVEVLLREGRTVEAAKYLYAVEYDSQRGLGPSDRLIHGRLMGDIFRTSLKIVEQEEEQEAEDQRRLGQTAGVSGCSCSDEGGKGGGGDVVVTGDSGKRSQKAIEFITVYEIIIGCLLRHPHFDEVVPQQLLPATAKYRQLLAKGHKKGSVGFGTLADA